MHDQIELEKPEFRPQRMRLRVGRGLALLGDVRIRKIDRMHPSSSPAPHTHAFTPTKIGILWHTEKEPLHLEHYDNSK
ncbi:hypothetical protein CEXT_605261 [Caerostris extrusa]|uniref:Uncharacterized protein n=1 Tax=Caerostris extrusa TaxID=172846 RepID=A0AAV4Q1H3_CAEEX|nr:hypothetical protein CEXT_605261 [Caerostris extrusa]